MSGWAACTRAAEALASSRAADGSCRLNQFPPRARRGVSSLMSLRPARGITGEPPRSNEHSTRVRRRLGGRPPSASRSSATESASRLRLGLRRCEQKCQRRRQATDHDQWCPCGTFSAPGQSQPHRLGRRRAPRQRHALDDVPANCVSALPVILRQIPVAGKIAARSRDWGRDFRPARAQCAAFPAADAPRPAGAMALDARPSFARPSHPSSVTCAGVGRHAARARPA